MTRVNSHLPPTDITTVPTTGLRPPAMASPFPLPTVHHRSLLIKTPFWGKSITPHSPLTPLRPPHRRAILLPSAKFDLFELLGGRGLCSGEKGLEQELQKSPQSSSADPSEDTPSPLSPSPIASFGDGAFEKELLGLTGGFPGGERGLKTFIEKNPPPKKPKKVGKGGDLVTVKKPEPPELPLLMPGMIVIVKNPSNPFHMYCGIVQRVTDGKAGVLFEGGNWDKLLTFRLDELERREKGPPMVNPKSAILEEPVEK